MDEFSPSGSLYAMKLRKVLKLAMTVNNSRDTDVDRENFPSSYIEADRT